MKLQVSSLNAWYGPAHILFDLGLEVGEGEVVALLGRNGAGKSTTFKSLVGLLERRSGRIVYEGKDLSGRPTHEVVRAGLGYVPEDRRIFTELTVEENLRIGAHLNPAGRAAGIERAYTLFPVLAGRRKETAGYLSGGEQQRLALARCWALAPEVLFLDEPTASLDPGATRQVEEIVAAIAASGTKIVMTSHDLGQARRVGGDVLLLLHGTLNARAPAGCFFDQPPTPEAAAFLRGELVW